MIEILGYVASAFTIMSFLMKDIIKLRIINLVACIMFITYGLLIISIPVVIVNSIVAIININILLKHKK